MTMQEFIQGNKDAHKHFFDTETMRFFHSRVVMSSWNGDGLFITSEKFDAQSPRRYSIRRGNLTTFDVDSVGEFQQYNSSSSAQSALHRLRQFCGVPCSIIEAVH